MSAMSTADRAKQFLPFAALKGFEEAVIKRQKLDFEPVILGEDAAAELDAKIRALAKGDTVRIIYYANREFKEVRGRLKAVNETSGLLELEREKIEINSMISLDKENE